MTLRRRQLLQAAAGLTGAAAWPVLLGEVPAAAGVRLPVALTPPMGWNSWDCFGASVREEEVKANADYMAKHLRRYGWEYIVVDIQWYEPTADGSQYHANAKLDMDMYGRLIPAVNRFPSAAEGQGFKLLADYCHHKGLKFGIHILRGIPRQAVAARTPILGTNLTAADVANTKSLCPWNTDMYGVDTTKPGSQAWYDSLLKLYADWGVDFIKVDDLSAPYATGEIEQIHAAVEKCGRPVVFSTSPGETPVERAEHIETHANMWRISGDFWDRWDALLHNFTLCAKWQGHAAPGHWPDADMLPLGHIGLRSSENGRARSTNFTPDEQITMMTLWCIARSPLMFGGHLPDNDDWTLSLLTNPEVLEVLKHSTDNRQAYREQETVLWTARDGKKGHYVAFFNLGRGTSTVNMNLSSLGLPGACRVRDLWQRKDLGRTGEDITTDVASHGAKLFRLTPA